MRRKEIEVELRKIFADNVFTGTDYNPAEGFLFEADYLLSRFVRFEEVIIRYSVYLVGERFTEIYESTAALSAPYGSDIKRAFLSERKTIEDINADEATFLIIELINITNKGGNKTQELIGWTLVKLFTESHGLI